MCDSCTNHATLDSVRDVRMLPIGTRFPLVDSETIFAKTGDDRIDAVEGENLPYWEGRFIKIAGPLDVHPIP